MTDLTTSMPMTADALDRPPKPALAWLGDAGGFVLGAVLLFGAYAKILDPLAFVEQIRSERLDFLLPAAVVAFVALALETGLGALLVLGARRLWVLVPSALLVAFFLFLTGRTYYLDSRGLLEAEAGCGCFGNLVERTPAEAFWQDLLLLVPGLLLAFLWRRSGSLPRRRISIALGLTAAVLVFAWKAPDLPLDNLATRLKPGTSLSEICSGSEETRLCLLTVVPELEEGRHLVILAELDDESFTSHMDRLNEIASSVSVVVLSSGTIEEQRAFFWQWGPTFEIAETPESLLKPLYRTLPRSFEVRDGTVTATYSGVPENVSIGVEGGSVEPLNG